MHLLILAFVIGVCTLQLFAKLPSLEWLMLLPILGLMYLGLRKLRVVKYLVAFAAGLAWALIYAHWIMNWSLPKILEKQPIVITGSIASLPIEKPHLTTFVFQTSKIANQAIRTKLKLSWYSPTASLKVGDQWQLQVRLKQPHGMLNPGGNDYEKYLFQQHIRASGYIVNSTLNQLKRSTWYCHPIDRLRQTLQAKIKHSLLGDPLTGIITTLVIGDQGGILPEQWQVFRNTGTSYLMAISGLHIGFVGTILFFLVQFCWRRSEKLLLFMPAIHAAAIAGLLAASIYGILSGLSVPTQRAIIMLLTFTSILLLRRNSGGYDALLFTLLIIILINPLSVLSIGLWLSFTAVAVIIYVNYGRLRLNKSWWKKYWRLQFTVTIGILPLTLLLFQQTSLISLVTNLIALPGVCLIVIPVGLTGAMLLCFSESIGGWMLWVATKIMGIIWMWLERFATFSAASWCQPIFSWWIFAATMIGVLLLLAPRGWPGKVLSLGWFLPLFFIHPAQPKSQEVWFTLLDVGQGLASVVQTQHHTLVFDTGPKYEDHDSGQDIVIPFLHQYGIKNIDRLVISHGDNDHIGGAFSILQAMPVAAISTSVTERFHHAAVTHCYAGQSWRWDGIDFTFLYPPANSMMSGNNRSCVLHIQSGKNSLLLTGDIERDAEKILVEEHSSQLLSNIMVAPHHGSSTSSTSIFLKAVQPKIVLFPVGYLNRFHFPHPSVIQRYLELSSQMLNTADSGAITFKFDADSDILRPSQYRIDHRKYWNY